MNAMRRDLPVLILLLVLIAVPLRAATIAWDGGGNGTSWSDAANWSGDVVPGGGDHAVITLNGTYTVRLTATTAVAGLTLGGASGVQTLDASGFRLDLGTEPSTVDVNGVLVVGGAPSDGIMVITIDGPLTVRGRFDWTNGMIYANTYYLPPAGRVITIASGGTMRWLGAGTRQIAVTLDNQGTLRWENGITWFQQGYWHGSSGTFDIALTDDALFGRTGVNSVGPWIFTNTGTIRKSGPGAATIQVEIRTIGGSVDVLEDTLLQNTTSRWENARVSVATGATLLLAANRTHEPHTVAGTLSGNPLGTFLVSGLPGAFHTSLVADTAGGIVDIGGTGLQIDNAELGGYLYGSPNIFSPAPTNRGLMRLIGGNLKMISGRFVNEDTLRWENGVIAYMMTSSGFINNGLFEMAIDDTLSFQTGGVNGIRPGPFINNATVRKTGTGRVDSRVDFHTINGTVDVRAGVLVQHDPSRWEDATVSIDTGALLQLAGYVQPHVIAGTLRADPEGTFLVANTSPGYISEIVMDTLRGGRLEIGGTGIQMANLNVGRVNGPPPPVNGGLLRFVGDPQTIVGNFRNDGTVLWEGGDLRVNPGVIFTNNGSIDLLAAGRTYLGDGFAGVSTLVNEAGGVIRKPDTGQITIRVTVMNRGRLEVDDGILYIENTFNNVSVFTNDTSGVISGRGTLNVAPLEWPAPGRIINTGTVAPGAGTRGAGIGTLTVIGALPLDSLEFQLGGADSARYDRLIVAGTTPPDLDSATAFVDLANGFTPTPGDTFDVVWGAVTNELFAVIDPIPTASFIDTYPGTGVQLVFQGVAGEQKIFEVIAPTVAARQGERIDLPIVVVTPASARGAGATEVTVELRFNRTLLVPIESTPRGRIDGNDRVIALRIPLSSSVDTTTVPLRFRATLGNDSTTVLALDSAASNGTNVTVSERDGLFRLLDLCYEGGARLLNPDGVTMNRLRSDPGSGTISFDLTLIERGATKIMLGDLGGNIVRTFIEGEMPRGTREVQLDVGEIASGRYFIIVQTPTVRLSRQIEVIR